VTIEGEAPWFVPWIYVVPVVGSALWVALAGPYDDWWAALSAVIAAAVDYVAVIVVVIVTGLTFSVISGWRRHVSTSVTHGPSSRSGLAGAGRQTPPPQPGRSAPRGRPHRVPFECGSEPAYSFGGVSGTEDQRLATDRPTWQIGLAAWFVGVPVVFAAASWVIIGVSRLLNG